MDEISTARQKIVEAFADVPRPDLSVIHPLGCCEEHEPDFEWYRHHTWREFERGLPSERFDPFEFRTLHPLAYHYFVPGILMATLESLEENPGGLHLWEGSWVGTLTPLKKYVEAFKHRYRPLFSAAQKDALASHLELFNEWHMKRHGYKDRDIERAVAVVWRDAT